MKKESPPGLSVDNTENYTTIAAYWDANLICRFASNAFLTWFGLKPQDMINKMHIRKVLGNNENSMHILAALHGEEQSFDRTITSPNGQLIRTRANYYPDIADGKVKGFFAHADIRRPVTDGETDETAANGVLTAMEKLLKDVTETLKDNILKHFPGIPYLSKKHFISESKLKRDFKLKYNSTIFNYYRNLQMELAHQYITKKKYNKNQVAILLNFSNPSNFSACYQKYLRSITSRRLLDKAKKEHEVRYEILIKETPIAIAMVDMDLRFLAASTKWVGDYNLSDKDFIGELLYDVFPGSELTYSDMFSACLKGDINKCDEGFIDTLDGRPAWIRWDIRPWYNGAGETGGLSIFTEDITAQKLMEDEIIELSVILNKTADIARVGVWLQNFKTKSGIWSKTFKEILDVPQVSEPPSLEKLLSFYKKGPDRDMAEKMIEDAIKNGTQFNFEAEVITAKNKSIKARVIGYPEFVDGQCHKIYGIFQELNNIGPVQDSADVLYAETN